MFATAFAGMPAGRPIKELGPTNACAAIVLPTSKKLRRYILSEISFLDFQISFSISQATIPLVLRTEFFLREPFPTPQGEVVALPEKSKTGNPVFLLHSTNTSPPTFLVC